MARTYQVISADGHVEVPPEHWTKYVPERWKERAPRLVVLEEGEGWVIEGQPLLHNGQNITAGKTIRFRGDTYFTPDGGPATGAGDAAQRLREQDQDGIDAEVLFPPVFATRFLEGIKERDVYLSMVQAYNTFLAQDYCSVAPDRLIGNAVMPVTGIDDAVAELKRCHEIGLRTVAPHQFPNGSGTIDSSDDKFWGTLLDLDMKLSPHFSIGDRLPAVYNVGGGTGHQQFAAAMVQRNVTPPMYTIAQFVLEGVFDRFPDLRIYFAETNAGWMPAAFFLFDDNYAIFKDWFNGSLKKAPSDYVKKHVMFSFIRDPIAMELRDHLPTENLMWGSDFPHSVGSFPKSQEWLRRIFDGVPDTVRRQVLLENPARFFDLDLEAPITPTPSLN